jgi:hypothetical protein
MQALRNPLNAVQQGVYARLKGDMADVSVWDFIPPDSPYPYVVIGEAVLDMEPTKDGGLWIVRCPFFVWTKNEGMRDLNTLSGSVFGSLTREKLDLEADSFSNYFVSLETVGGMRTSKLTDGTNFFQQATLNLLWKVQDMRI